MKAKLKSYMMGNWQYPKWKSTFVQHKMFIFCSLIVGLVGRYKWVNL